MKTILSIIFILVSLNGFAQQWTEYKVDSNLTVTIPDNFVAIDTLEQHIIKAQISNALILIQRMANLGKTATSIQSKNELIKNYEEFQKGAVESQHGKLIDQQMLEKNGVQMIQFSFSASMGKEKQIRHFLVAFLNEKWYSISFWEVEALTSELKAERNKLFSSVKFLPSVGLKNQMTGGDLAYRSGYLFGKIIIYTLIIVGVVALIRLVSKKRQKKSNQV